MRRPLLTSTTDTARKLVLIALAAMALATSTTSTAGAQKLPRRFTIDASHSSASFGVKFMAMSTVHGAFSDLSGTIMYDERNPAASSVTAVIGTETINTNARQRDTHLRSPDFFDVKKYPYITFTSEHIKPTAKGFIMTGPLSIHGVTKIVAIPVTQMNKPMPDAWGNTRTTFHGAFTISRKEYGVLGTAFWNSEYDPGRMAVSDRVDIDLLISANVVNPLKWTQPFGDSLLAQIEAHGLAPVMDTLRSRYPNVPRLDSVPDFAFAVAAEKLIAHGRVADGVLLYTTLVSLRPKSAYLRQQLGEAYVKAGQLDKARAEFERVVADEPLATTSSEWLRVLKRRP